jgi:dolichyl-phosphate-mannose--protein O-mannosyl transferase
MMISKIRVAAPSSQTLIAIAVVLFAMLVLETIRMVLFQTVLLDQPVAKAGTVAVMCAALVKVIQWTCLRWGHNRALRIAGFVFACAGATTGYLPTLMITGRPVYAHVTPLEVAFACMGAAAGLVCFLTILSRAWRRPHSRTLSLD